MILRIDFLTDPEVLVSDPGGLGGFGFGCGSNMHIVGNDGTLLRGVGRTPGCVEAPAGTEDWKKSRPGTNWISMETFKFYLEVYHP